MILYAEYHLKQVKHLTEVMVSQQTLQKLSEPMNKHLNFLLHVDEPSKISSAVYANIILLKLFCVMVFDVIVLFIINRPSKSNTFAVNWSGDPEKSKLDGLKSYWIISSLCKYCNPNAAWLKILILMICCLINLTTTGFSFKEY